MKKCRAIILFLVAVQLLILQGCSESGAYRVLQDIERKQCLESGVAPVECFNRTSNSSFQKVTPAAPPYGIPADDALAAEIERAVTVVGPTPIS
jgi:hypothetical protein